MKKYPMMLFNKIYDFIGHLIGRITKRYYFEDYVRVHPDGVVFNKFGRVKKPSKNDLNNFLNYTKFYKFVAQFVKNKTVADIGCGAGHGCKILNDNGAKQVYGCDISKGAIEFAISHYSNFAAFSIQGITDMKKYHDDFFDITISSEVLEHIKEYGLEEEAIKEMKRVTRNNGLIVIGTPNSEMLGEHGFSFDEINALFKRNFSQFVIFENALTPFGNKRGLWEKRLSENNTGVIISEYINP